MCKGSASKATTATQAPDPSAYALYNQLLTRASGVANTPYEAYGGQLVAPVNEQQMAGTNTINSAPGMYNAAYNTIQGAGQPLTADQIQQYQNPYTQNVVNATQAQYNNQNEAARQKLLGSAAAQGALGGNRIGVAEAELANQQQLAQAPTIAGLYSNSYQSGVNTALSQQQAAMQAGQGMAGVAQGILGAGGAQIGAGSLQQQTQQAQNEALYNQWQNEKAYPFQTTQWLANLGTGVGSQMGGTSTTTPPAPNVGSQILGGATTGIGMLGATGAFGSAGWLMPMLAGLARGGRVKSYAAGGVVPDDVVPESLDTLLAQQEQLKRGDRDVQMFPEGTDELPVPEGIARTETDRGAFHFDPSKVGVADVQGASAQGRENELLDLGPFSKEDIAELVAKGERPLVIVERAPDDTEVRAALGTKDTVPAQLEAMEKAKSPENEITVEDLFKVLQERQQSGVAGVEEAPQGFALGGAPKKIGSTPWSNANGYISVPEFNMVKGKTMPAPPSLPREDQNPASKLNNLGALGGSAYKNPTGVVHTPGDYSAAFPDPGANSSYAMGDYQVPVFGTPMTAARGGAIGVAGIDPNVLQEVYGIDRVPGFDRGGGVDDYTPNFNFEETLKPEPLWYNPEATGLPPNPSGIAPAVAQQAAEPDPALGRVYRNNELSPLDPPSGPTRDMLIRTVLAEAGNQGPEGMQAVANVVRNRAVNGGFGGDKVEGVVQAPNQFEPYNTPAGRARMAAYDPNSPAYKAAAAAVDRAYTGEDPTGGATHFYAPGTQAALGRRAPSWDDGTGKDIGDHRFFGGKGQGVVTAGRQPEDGDPMRSDAVTSQRASRNGVAPTDDYAYSPPSRNSGVDWSSEGKLWPSLITAGLGMLASRSPHFGVGVGEGGLAGAQAYSQMREGELQRGQSQQRINLEAKRLQQSADVEARRAREAEWPYTRLSAAQQAELLKPVQIGLDKYYNPVYAIRDPKTGGYKVIDAQTGRPKDEFDNPQRPVPPAQPGQPGVSAPPPANPGGFPPAAPAVEQREASAGDETVPVNARMVSGQAVGTMRDPAAGAFNESVLDNEPPRIANQVRAIARGIERAPNLERNNKYNQYLMEKVREYDPDFDATMFARRQQTAKEFSTGVGARNLTSIKTLAGHLEHLYEVTKKLDNSNTSMWNAANQGIAKRTDFVHGKEYQGLLAEYENARKAVADETAKAFAGTSSALADREEWMKMSDPAAPKSMQMAGIKMLTKLVDSRMEAATDQYNSGMNTRREPWSLVEPKYKDIYDRMRRAGSEEAEKKPGAEKSATPKAPSDAEKAKAMEWLKKNPDDPRAPAIRKRLGIE